jgi:hypothetical protein
MIIKDKYDIIKCDWQLAVDNDQEKYIKESKYLKFFHPVEYDKLFSLQYIPPIICSNTGDYANVVGSTMDQFILDHPMTDFYISGLEIAPRKNLHILPIGLLQCQIDIIQQQHDDIPKNNLIYSNFAAHTHHSRNQVLNIIKTKKFITHKESYLTNFSPVTIETIAEKTLQYYNELSTYKFAISPRGNGIDTYRMYECLYLGVIPIVQKSNFTQYFTNKIPILEVDSYDILTEDFLYRQMDIDNQQNMNILNRSYYINMWYDKIIQFEKEDR